MADDRADHDAHEAAPSPPPAWLICPRCGAGGLVARGDGLACRGCGAAYGRENGFLNLLKDPRDRFADDSGCCDHENEERSNALTTQSYYLPLWARLKRRLADGNRPLRVLSAGCGVGVDVDIHCDHGLDAWGIDCGGRVAHWPQRRRRSRLLIANVKAVPFATGSFDVVKTDCLLPHVGVAGDTTRVVPTYGEQRLAVARELTRVVRPGGLLIMANPNRLCPIDLFHKGQMKGGRGLGRFHSPRERFLLAFEDYRHLFVESCCCAAIETLPIAHYWNFSTMSTHPLRRHLVPLLKAYFALLSVPALPALRRSPLNPWLMVAVTK